MSKSATPSKPKPKPKKQPSRNKKVLMFLLKWGFVVGVWGVIVLLAMGAWFATDLPDVRKLTEDFKTPTITVLAEDNSVIARLGNVYGKYLTIKDMPKNLVNAVVATEDRRFFHHFGIDLWGLLRASVVNFKEHRIVQGGSTITQQLAKITFLSPERTFRRKMQEMMLALWLEYNFSKDEIFTIYMNRVYLGGGTYGVDAASEFYFHKPARKMNLYECAMIAGLLKPLHVMLPILIQTLPKAVPTRFC
ncbi:MAG: transglycosylase domain-containing protein [Alphaproteobacteria bacterium]|nr:transglycosylase domain-containing protein [Alphaproteobacteria bacterium]